MLYDKKGTYNKVDIGYKYDNDNNVKSFNKSCHDKRNFNLKMFKSTYGNKMIILLIIDIRKIMK